MRSQFTFYESFYDALKRIKKKADRADAFDALCKYALYGESPNLDQLPDTVAVVFVLIKPNLDASARKAAGGKRGSPVKEKVNKKESKSKDRGKIDGRYSEDSGNEKEKEKEKEKEGEIENECCCYPPYPLTDPAFGEVFRAYTDRINPFASETVRTELQHFTKAVGRDVVLWAFDAALDAKKATWNYIRAILRDKEQRGVRCLADLQPREKVRESRAPEQQKTFLQIVAEREGSG